MNIAFERDEVKNIKNNEKHGLFFEDVIPAFLINTQLH